MFSDLLQHNTEYYTTYVRCVTFCPLLAHFYYRRRFLQCCFHHKRNVGFLIKYRFYIQGLICSIRLNSMRLKRALESELIYYHEPEKQIIST